MNDFLQPYVLAGNIKNKNGEEFYLDKNRVSRILQQKDDVPLALRACLDMVEIREKTAKEFDVYIRDNIEPVFDDLLTAALMELIDNDDDIPDARKENIRVEKDNLHLFLTDVLLTALPANNTAAKMPGKIVIHNGAYSVDVLVGDVLSYGFDNRRKQKNIVVIPVNTSFETAVSSSLEACSKPLVSENTIHGQWLRRYVESGHEIPMLDQRIESSLKGHGFVADERSMSEIGKQICYPIGSIAVIEENNACYFLLAISAFDADNRAQASVSVLKAAISSLMEFYDAHGQGYDMYLPLIGTGRSRTGLSLQQAYDMMVRIIGENKTKILGNIHITLNPRWAEQVEIKEQR